MPAFDFEPYDYIIRSKCAGFGISGVSKYHSNVYLVGNVDKLSLPSNQCARVKRSTTAHPLAPLTHTTVPASVSSSSGIMHLISSSRGHGHSEGRATQTRLSGHKYEEHGTVELRECPIIQTC